MEWRMNLWMLDWQQQRKTELAQARRHAWLGGWKSRS
jgi:hypothetical protein